MSKALRAIGLALYKLLVDKDVHSVIPELAQRWHKARSTKAKARVVAAAVFLATCQIGFWYVAVSELLSGIEEIL